MSTPSTVSANPEYVPTRHKRSFFRSGREDSPFKRLIIHIVLILACIVSVFRSCACWQFHSDPGTD